jgi:hypothetical protein
MGIGVQMPKLFLVFAVNCTMSILKDRAFAKLFGTIPPSNVPIGKIILIYYHYLINNTIFNTNLLFSFQIKMNIKFLIII